VYASLRMKDRAPTFRRAAGVLLLDGAERVLLMGCQEDRGAEGRGGEPARGLAHYPLGIIALFIVVVHRFASVVVQIGLTCRPGHDRRTYA
jgi:hypothetical protein